jgi:hypothetical protein
MTRTHETPHDAAIEPTVSTGGEPVTTVLYGRLDGSRD